MKKKKMSPLLRRLNYFSPIEHHSNHHSQTTSEDRDWENVYRNRWQYDKVVRSTHGVNCTGSCSWNIYVKNGIVTWEGQNLNYPSTGPDMPDFEPRGCPRGASFSWYIYSPLRVKYPYVRGVLINLWREEVPGAQKVFNDRFPGIQRILMRLQRFPPQIDQHTSHIWIFHTERAVDVP